MQKWHLSPAMGKPLIHRQLIEHLPLCLRQFHGSAQRAQESDNLVLKSPRKGRSPSTDQDIRNLFQSSASSLQAPLGEATRNLVRRVVLEKTPPSRAYPSRSIPPQGALDARNLAATPSPGAYQPRRAYPQNPQGGAPARRPFFARKPNVPPRQRLNPRGKQSGPKRTPRRGGRASSGPRTKGSGWSTEELEYLAAQAESEEQDYVDFEPEEVSLDNLRGNGPSLAMGTWGMSELVGERLGRIERMRAERELGVVFLQRKKKYAAEEAAENAGDEEGDDAAVENMKKSATTQTIPSKGDDASDEPKEDTHPLTEEEKGEFVKRLLGGQYVMGGGVGSGGQHSSVIKNIWRQASRNESYTPANGELLVGKVGMLLPTGAKNTNSLTERRRG